MPPPMPPRPPSALRRALSRLNPLRAARHVFLPSRTDRIDDHTVRWLQGMRAAAGLAAVVWLALSYRLVSSASELADERFDQVWVSLCVAGATLPFITLAFIMAARPPLRRVYLRRALRPLGALGGLFGSMGAFPVAMTPETQGLRDWFQATVPGAQVIAIVAFCWILPFAIAGIVFCTFHVFRASDVHELLPPLLAIALVWEMALVDLLSGTHAEVPFGLRVVFMLGGPLTVSAIAAYEMRRLRTRHGITMRTALAR